MRNIGAYFKIWPILLLVVVYGLAYYNVDYFLIPTLLALGFSKAQVLLIAGTWGFTDMLGGYIGWSGFRGMIGELFKDDTDFKSKVRGEIEPQGYADRVKIYLCRKYVRFFDEENNTYRNQQKGNGKLYIMFGRFYLMFDIFSDRLIKIVFNVLKGGSLATSFFVGLAPFPGPRMVADIFCGTTRWRTGFLAVALGNFLKTFGFVYGWNWIIS